MTQCTLKIGEIIKALGLEPHIEGGFFRRTYQSDDQNMVVTAGGQRHCMTSIFYLLTQNSPIGHFHLNQSDIVHYYHLGDPIQYTLIFPDGTLKTVVMGHDVLAAQCLQLHVPGGIWKASQVMHGAAGYGNGRPAKARTAVSRALGIDRKADARMRWLRASRSVCVGVNLAISYYV